MTTDTRKTKKEIFKKILPSLLPLALIVLLAGLSFIPAARSAGAGATRVGDSVEPEAVAVLRACVDYARDYAFSSATNGEIKAKVFGVPFSQSVEGTRKVHGVTFECVTESVSALVKAGVKRTGDGNVYTVAKGEYKNKKFEYADGREMTCAEYTEHCGAPPLGIVCYELDGAIIAARKISDESFSFVLDPVLSTVQRRNEIKAALGCEPKYTAVEFTLVTDGTRAFSVTATEKFSIDKFGGADCTAVYTEKFAYSE